MSFAYFICFIASLLFSFILTHLVKVIAVKQGWGILPASKHHIHRGKIPRLGGVAIYLSFVAVIILFTFGAERFHVEIGLTPKTLLYILLPGSLVFLIGLYDDLRGASAYVKVAVQSLAATMLFFQGFRVAYLPLLFGEQNFGWVALPVTILWVLLITNAFNLIDGLDGLAAGSGLFSTMAVFIAALINFNMTTALLTVTLAGAILGFLRFNFNPATIFLGDSGSLFIGFMLSAFALLGVQKTSTIVAVAIPVVSFGLPILETAISVVRRFLNGQPLFAADTEHINHKLLERGFSQRQSVIILYGVSAVCGLLSLFLLAPGGGTVGIVLFVLGVGVWIGVQHLGYHEFFELRRVARRTIEQKKIIVNNVVIRKATAQLAKAKTHEEICEIIKQTFEDKDFDSVRLIVHQDFGDVSFLGRSVETNLCYEWNRSEALDETACWTLKLDLISEDKQPIGYFSISRISSDKALLIDVNLFICGFQAALISALTRARELANAAKLAKEERSVNLAPNPGSSTTDLGLRNV
jgi:UDP-GlcNAc:undecaprenyl-phosphate GlcNAc-1-phosphate transferase